MTELHLPWLEISILIPLIGAFWVNRIRDPDVARRACLVFSGLTLICEFSEWQDFDMLHVAEADDKWHFLSRILGRPILVIDHLSAPLLPLTALLFFLTAIATLRTKIRRFSFPGMLVSEALTLATFSCKEPIGVIILLALSTIPPYLELRAREKPTGVYVAHMSLFVAMLALGWGAVVAEGSEQVHSLWALVPLLIAVFIRGGIVPVHCWMTDLFEHATFGTALMYVTPIAGAYAASRLVLPICPDWVLRSIGLVSLVTAVYAAGMAIVQREARRFFCYLFLSHSALVFVGLEAVTPIGLTGGLSVWLSAALALTGFGLTLRAIESRRGRIALVDFQGLYEHSPALAVCYILTGLASVGFPGTSGFVGTEMLVDGAVIAYPYIGVTVVIASALNGIAIVKSYFIIFTGTRHSATVSLKSRPREKAAVLTLTGLILIGGLIPQPGIATRFQAAEELLMKRSATPGVTDQPYDPDHSNDDHGGHVSGGKHTESSNPKAPEKHEVKHEKKDAETRDANVDAKGDAKGDASEANKNDASKEGAEK